MSYKYLDLLKISPKALYYIIMIDIWRYAFIKPVYLVRRYFDSNYPHLEALRAYLYHINAKVVNPRMMWEFRLRLLTHPENSGIIKYWVEQFDKLPR